MIKLLFFMVGFPLVGIVTIITGNAQGSFLGSHTISPPGLTELGIETRVIQRDKRQYKIPNGWGINNITVIVPEGMEEGAKRARDLLDMLHQKSFYFFEIGRVEISIKAHSRVEALSEIKRWIKVFGGSL